MEDEEDQAEEVGGDNTFLEEQLGGMVFLAYDGVVREGEYKPDGMEESIVGCRKEGTQTLAHGYNWNEMNS